MWTKWHEAFDGDISRIFFSWSWSRAPFFNPLVVIAHSQWTSVLHKRPSCALVEICLTATEKCPYSCQWEQEAHYWCPERGNFNAKEHSNSMTEKNPWALHCEYTVRCVVQWFNITPSTHYHLEKYPGTDSAPQGRSSGRPAKPPVTEWHSVLQCFIVEVNPWWTYL